MNKLKKIALLFVLSVIQLTLWAQDMDKKTEDPTDFMRSSGKIYVVVACVVVIVSGIYIYLINLDRKIKKLENKG